MKLNYRYLILANFTVVIGLASRQIVWVPLFTGDVLYGVMIFFIIRMCSTKLKLYNIAGLALALTYTVELSQLYQANWINNIRSTLLGRLVLGQGFLWSDIMAYSVGVLLALGLARCIERAL
jgi:hypothetical protein